MQNLLFICAVNNASLISVWLILILMEIAVVWFLALILSCSVPAFQANTSRDNCFRMDGTKSKRRSDRELDARRQFFGELMGTLALAALTGNLLFFFVDSFLIPLPVVTESLSLFSTDLDSWRDKISDRSLDREFAIWSGLGQFGNNEINQKSHFVKSTFPILLGAFTLWFVGCLYLVRTAYRTALQKYCKGIGSRNNEYLNMDIGRLQNATERTHSSEPIASADVQQSE